MDKTFQPTNPLARTVCLAMMAATMMSGTGSVYAIERAPSWRHYVQTRTPLSLDFQEILADSSARPDVRTPAEHIENIRSILNPPVSDLSSLFDVSRQAIYKWLAGSSSPEESNLGRILDLSKIADAFREAGISRADTLLKMKTFGGLSLMDLIKAGENLPEHVTALIAEAHAMESSYQQSRLAISKAKPTRDWQTSLSIPGSIESL